MCEENIAPSIRSLAGSVVSNTTPPAREQMLGAIFSSETKYTTNQETLSLCRMSRSLGCAISWKKTASIWSSWDTCQRPACARR